jgi:hypothetical protein
MNTLYDILIYLIQGLFAFVPLAGFYLAWRYPDKRTTIYHRYRGTLVLSWIVVILLNLFALPVLSDVRDYQAKVKLRPRVQIDIQQSLDYIAFSMAAPDSNQVTIDDLFFKFDLPGQVISTLTDHKDKIDHCGLFVAFSSSVANDTVAQTMHVHCRTMLPGAYLRVNINYRRTAERPIPGSDLLKDSTLKKQFRYVPVMDLHDYSRALYTWQFKGESVSELEYYNLRHLEYIQSDNENLLRMWRHEDFYTHANPPNLQQILDSLRTRWSDSSLQASEWQRRDW